MTKPSEKWTNRCLKLATFLPVLNELRCRVRIIFCCISGKNRCLALQKHMRVFFLSFFIGKCRFFLTESATRVIYFWNIGSTNLVKYFVKRGIIGYIRTPNVVSRSVRYLFFLLSLHIVFSGGAPSTQISPYLEISSSRRNPRWIHGANREAGYGDIKTGNRTQGNNTEKQDMATKYRKFR